jgi:AcrR family transcriptional regulator
LARGRSVEVEALRRRIVVEATRLFAEVGYRGTSIQMIADAVGIGKTLVLYHYPSKEVLRASVIDEISTLWQDLLPRLVEGLGTQQPTLATFDPTLEVLRKNPQATRFVLRELLDKDSGLASELRERLIPGTMQAAELVGQLRGGADSEDVLAELILAGLSLLAVLAVFLDDSGKGDALADRVIAAALRKTARALNPS